MHGLVDILEAAYRFEGDADAWMQGVGQAIDKHLGHGLGLIAIRYCIGDDFSFQPMSMLPINMAPEGVAAVQAATATVPPSYIAATFAKLPCDIARSTEDPDARQLTNRIFLEHFEVNGWVDCMPINGIDPTNQGVCFGVWLPERGTMTPALHDRWSRVAAHLAAARRLRERIAAAEARADAAEAVLTPGGRVEHAENIATSQEAREQLVAGVRALERSRGKLQRSDPDLALAERKALIAARWTLVDHFESDGKHYVLAQRNEAMMRGFETLTSREHQALGFASLGHANKLIAYEMGIAPSTVSVLLHRAAKKLGTTSRTALIGTYKRLVKANPPIDS